MPSLADARLYLCTDSRPGRGDLVDFLDAVLANGVDVVQLREKNLEAADELALLAVFAEACRRHGALLAVNDRADLAVAAGADVLHLGQRDLPPAVARRIVGPDVVIGRSSHSVEQARTAAADPDVDYFCVGPLWPTPTKLGRPGIGLDPVRAVADSAPAKPWFAIGGIDEGRLDAVLAAGARRAVVVRVLTEAADPGAVAARLAARLAEAG
jgi:thiamine-phosphate pyrophosphorylase